VLSQTILAATARPSFRGAGLRAASALRGRRLNRRYYEKLHSEIEALAPEQPALQMIRNEALTALEAGELSQGRSLLEQFINASAPVPRRMGQDVPAMVRAQAALGWIAMLQLNFLVASSHFHQAGRLLPTWDSDLYRDYQLAEAEAFYCEGQEHGDEAALRKAIKLRQEVLGRTSRRAMPMQWLTLQNEIGNALLALGERQSRRKALKQAVAAFQAALEVWPPDQAPLERAMIETKLGVALTRLGERAGSRRRLDEAGAAFRSALARYPRDEMPLGWASLQNYLGLALLRLAERESGTLRAHAASNTFRAALEERTRERAPADWARTQHNLGLVLLLLGERESSALRLEAAAAAFRAALEERTPEDAPLDWAATRIALAKVLISLGVREGGTTRLQEAIAVLREVMTVVDAKQPGRLLQEARDRLAEAERLLARRKKSGGGFLFTL
jgi:tetratricopeptide (TPR) repeat protein